MRLLVSSFLLLLLPMSALGQGPPPAPLFPYVVPYEYADLPNRWYGSPPSSFGWAYLAEWNYDFTKAPAPTPPTTYYYGYRTYVVWTAEYRAAIGTGTATDVNRFRWKGSTEAANAEFNSKYTGPGANGKNFSVNGETVVGFLCSPDIVHNYSIKKGTIQWGVWRSYFPADDGKVHPRVRFYIVETFAVPTLKALNTSQLVWLDERGMVDPDEHYFVQELRTFNDVGSSVDGSQGYKATIKGGFEEEEWADKIGFDRYSGGGVGIDSWNLHIPVIATAGVDINLNPVVTAATLGNASLGNSVSTARAVLRAFLLLLMYWAAFKRIVALFIEDKFAVLGAEAYEDDDEEEDD